MNFFDQDNQHVGMQVNADQITITMLMSGEFLRELRRWITLMQDQGLPDDEQYQGLPDDEQYEEVLEALYLAVNETRIYVSRLKGPMSGARFSPSDRSLSRASHKWIACRNLEQEKRLSRYWTKASLKLRRIDPDLAMRCFSKGDYWTNPDEWSDADIAPARIALDKIFQESRGLLNRR